MTSKEARPLAGSDPLISRFGRQRNIKVRLTGENFNEILSFGQGECA